MTAVLISTPERPLLPLSEECLDSMRLEVVEGYVLEVGWASLQDWDEASGLEPDGGQRLNSHPAEPCWQRIGAKFY